MPADHIQELGSGSYAAGQGICEKGYKETVTSQEEKLVELMQKRISRELFTEMFDGNSVDVYVGIEIITEKT